MIRSLERVTRGALAAGDHGAADPAGAHRQPGSALGLDYTDVEIPGELGTLPAWFVPGARDTWVDHRRTASAPPANTP